MSIARVVGISTCMKVCAAITYHHNGARLDVQADERHEAKEVRM